MWFFFLFSFRVWAVLKRCTHVNSVQRYTYMWNGRGEQPGGGFPTGQSPEGAAVQSQCPDPLLPAHSCTYTSTLRAAVKGLNRRLGSSNHDDQSPDSLASHVGRPDWLWLSKQLFWVIQRWVA